MLSTDGVGIKPSSEVKIIRDFLGLAGSIDEIESVVTISFD